MEAQAEQSVGAAFSKNKTLWIGDLEYWMTEVFIRCCYGKKNDFVSIKVMRNKNGESKGYGFLEFRSHDAAASFLQAHIAVSQLPNTRKPFTLNWAAYGNTNMGSTFDIFVGGLSPVITSDILEQVFSAKYGSVRGAEVVTDRFTGLSRGFGFVRFEDGLDQIRALDEMNGIVCFGRAIRVAQATAKKKRLETARLSLDETSIE
ncbi:hypothetical protein SUGI_0892470 [Cryptomeria japonica]|uniref:polyadenylate-binding protein RBP47-like n=1 Tax=Cryptomeria japonica TaxID=3369 RepID=UPI002414A0FF|nr:polyadenylate-binding protein RBP47-like [Cryptomeria japonica]GLJ43000.1 hypothetical protein SUGI_0892470 [Cryptomeria japonica]